MFEFGEFAHHPVQFVDVRFGGAVDREGRETGVRLFVYHNVSDSD